MNKIGKSLGCSGIIIEIIGMVYLPLMVVGTLLCCIGIVFDSFEDRKKNE